MMMKMVLESGHFHTNPAEALRSIPDNPQPGTKVMEMLPPWLDARESRNENMPKIDLKKDLKTLYTAPRNPELVDVPPMNFLMIDGRGDPNAEEFQQAMGALYSVAYALKFKAKKAGKDFTVMPPEGLFWTEGMSHFNPEDKTAWEWTLMIVQSEFVTEEMFHEALEEARKKRGLTKEPRFGAFHEGLSAQIMHIGPYAAEATTIRILHDFIREKGYQFNGRHHEIYLSDPRRAAPEKMKTIIRQPVKR